jgi:hypothetical protein
MTLRRAHPLLLAVPAVALAIAFFPAGCSGQSEGERCNTQSDNAGNDDCDGTLVCTPAGKLTNRDDVARCCPADLTQATSPACRPVGSGGTDAGPPSDASAGDAAAEATTSDGATDATADTEGDAADASELDGATDAPTDGADGGG